MLVKGYPGFRVVILYDYVYILVLHVYIIILHEYIINYTYIHNQLYMYT